MMCFWSVAEAVADIAEAEAVAAGTLPLKAA